MSGRLSIVITTYNRSDALQAVIAALSRQTDPDFEVVVADDGSTDQHQQAVHRMLDSMDQAARHVWHPDIGFTAACVRNRGVAAASGQYIIFLDGDCVPDRDFVARHRALQQSACFVNGSRVMLSPELTQEVIDGRACVDGRSHAFWLQQRLTGRASKATALWRLPAAWPRKQHAHFVWKGIRSCNMAVWRSDFEAINGFDESFVGWGHEDADFVLRLHNAGVRRINGFYATEVYHLWHREASRSTESINAAKVRDRMRSRETLPTSGYRESQGGSEVVIRRWR